MGLLMLGGLLQPDLALSAPATTPISTTGLKQLQATAAARVRQRQEQTRQVSPANYDLNRYPVTASNERHWRNILWTTALVEPQESYVAEALNGILALTRRSNLSKPQLRTIDMAMQVGTQLYLSQPALYASVGQQFRQTIERSSDPQWVAMALSGLAKAGLTPEESRRLSDRIRQRFPKWSQNAVLQTTLQDVASTLAPAPAPPLRDLLQWTIAPQQLQLYVICPSDRGLLCQAVLKDRKGQFVRQAGQLWSVPLLLRSLHGLSWNFERGQSPQGIYRIEGIVPQPDDQFFRAYGQFPLVKLFVPFEPGAQAFLASKKGSFKGNLQAYQALLPPSWRNYFPIQQSYWAGKIGRGLFRIHGSGEAIDFFQGNVRYPNSANWNPTIGCLSALELYNDAGALQQADMPKILNALRAAGGKNFSGYMIVVEAPGASGPISITDLEAAIAATPLRLSDKELLTVK